MYTVNKEIHFCYGHRLPEYEGKCRHLHGHSAKAVVSLASETLDRQGMVVDFGEIERVVKGWIDRELDHTMLLHREDPFLPTMQEAGERVYVMESHPTAENIARLIFEVAKNAGLPVVDVTLWETESASAAYRP